MGKLEILEENVIAAFKTGNKGDKDLLGRLFPEIFLEEPYLKACSKLGIKPKSVLADRSDADEVSADAFYRLTICIRAKNMIKDKIWKPVYDGSEQHWYPRWKLTDAGFGLTGTFYVRWHSAATVGERLEYRTRELALEGVKEFDGYYQDYLRVC